MIELKIKKIIVILSLLFILTLINFVNTDIPNVDASEYDVNVSTESEFIDVISNSNANTIISITLIENIELHQKIELNGQVSIQAKEQKEIKLLSNPKKALLVFNHPIYTDERIYFRNRRHSKLAVLKSG